MKKDNQRGVRNWKAWLVGVVAVAIGWNVVKYVTQPVTSAKTEASKYFQNPENQRKFAEIMGSLSEDPAFRSAIKQAQSGDPMLLAAKLGERGVPMLPDYMLLQRSEIYSKLLEGSDTALCARLVNGTPTGPDYARILAMLETLGPNDVSNWLTLSKAAADAALKKNPEDFGITVAQAEEAVQILTTKYSAAQRTDLLSFFNNPHSLSDATVCQVGRDLYKAALAVPEAKKAFVARALVAN